MSGPQPPRFALPSGAVDEDRAVATLQAAIRHASITGEEAAFAGFLAGALSEIGASEITLQDFEPGRPNVWGVKRGTGDGPRLLLIGHTDVVHVRGWRERWAGDVREDPFAAALVDGAIWGRGAADLKAGICMGIEALRTLDRASVALAGDVLLAFVGDEESGEPGKGVSAGMRHFMAALESGAVPRPDLAIYVEPSKLDVYTAQMGFFIADVAISGRTAYFGVPEQGADALKAAHAVLSALWAHSGDLEAGGAHDLVGRSFLLVTSIEAGGLIAVPGACRLSLIRKLRPGEDLGRARDDLVRVVEGAVAELSGISASVDFPAGRDHPVGGTPSEVDPNLAPVRLLAETAARHWPAGGRIGGAPFWSEASFLVAAGVPTVYFAPGDIGICHTSEERVNVDEYLAGIAVLAEFIAGYCGIGASGPNV
jgi:acetylornithine deacetylase